MVIWDLVPPQWRLEAFIAGEYAACPALASDLDLWIFVDSRGEHDHLPAARATVLEHIRGEGITICEEDGQTTTQYEGVNVEILKVGHIGYGVDIHVMVVDAPVNAVLEGFDVSTHQIALLPSGEVRLGSHWTPITEPPIRLIDTDHTAARMDKITRRYQREVRVNAEAA